MISLGACLSRDITALPPCSAPQRPGMWSGLGWSVPRAPRVSCTSGRGLGDSKRLADAANHRALMPRICSYMILSSRSAAASGSGRRRWDSAVDLGTPVLERKEHHLMWLHPSCCSQPEQGGGGSFKGRAEGLFSSLLTSGPTISGLLNQYYFFLSDFFFFSLRS